MLKPADTTAFENCVLVNKNNMSKINEQINEYESETVNELAKQKQVLWLNVLQMIDSFNRCVCIRLI